MNADSSSQTRFTFKKEERLSGKKLIDELFENGSSFYLQPFRILFLEKKMESLSSAQVLISVPKKNFKRAVDRNKIKRLIRESYRVNKFLLYSSLERNNKQLAIGILYTSKIMEPFSLIQEKIIAVLTKLAQQYDVVEKNSA